VYNSKTIFSFYRLVNGTIFPKQKSSRQGYNEDWYQKLYDSCITAYHGNRLYLIDDD